MRIIPVIDLMGDTVVHAIAGQRSAYRPVQSVLASQSTPDSIGRALSQTFQATSVYVADLDAIAGADPAWTAYRQIARCGLNLWVDAGLSSPERAGEFSPGRPDASWIERVVVGLESITSPEALQHTVRVIGKDRCIFSLDLRQGTPITGSAAWAGYGAVEIAQAAAEAGVRSMIVLDLARVGTGQGVGTLSLCRQLRALWPEINLVAGGGVRNLADLHDLQESGCHAALVASALHDGRLTRDILADAGHSL